AAAVAAMTATRELPRDGRISATKAVMTDTGHSAGHTDSSIARRRGRPTRLQPAGKRTRSAAVETGSSVPNAMPLSPHRLARAMLSARFTSDDTTFVYATVRCWPAPFRSVDDVEDATRAMTVSVSSRTTTTLPSNPGPTHALTSGLAISMSAPPMQST